VQANHTSSFHSIPNESRDRDFESFKSQKALGGQITSYFEDFIYNSVRIAFDEAWMRGLKWGWAQVNLELNERANSYISRTLGLIYKGTQGYSASARPTCGLRREETLDTQWFKSVVAHAIYSHVNQLAGFHRFQNPNPETLSTNLFYFYFSAMSTAWQVGWMRGEAHARELAQQREQQPYGILNSAQRDILDLERMKVNDIARRVFGLTPSQQASFDRWRDSFFSKGDYACA